MMRWKQSRALSRQLLPNEPASIRSGPDQVWPGHLSVTANSTLSFLTMTFAIANVVTTDHWPLSIIDVEEEEEGQRERAMVRVEWDEAEAGLACIMHISNEIISELGQVRSLPRIVRMIWSLVKSRFPSVHWLHLQPHLISMKLERERRKIGPIYSVGHSTRKYQNIF